MHKNSYIIYKIARGIIHLVDILYFIKKFKFSSNRQHVILAIEAGANGWKSIEYQELYNSAKEYLGDSRIKKLVLNTHETRLNQIKNFLKNNSNITHFLIDPRSSEYVEKMNIARVIVYSIGVLILLRKKEITPIVYLTDASHRVWRMQAAIMSCKSGVVATFISTKNLKEFIPHDRFSGPSIMPFSNKTLKELVNLKLVLSNTSKIDNLVKFAGSVYEPRAQFLTELKKLLGDKFVIVARELGSQREPDNIYWKHLCSARIIITTADQKTDDFRDRPELKQLVYRYTEVLASQTLLLAPHVPGIERYFIPGEDFVEYRDLNDAYVKALYYLEHVDEAKEIASQGHSKMRNMIERSFFWQQIDYSLGKNSMI